jgi:sec-independent protein translocase protein TatA
MAGLGTSEILIILLVVLLLFGSTKLPQLARSLGKSARILKAETKGLRDDDDEQPAPQQQPQQAQAQPGPVQPGSVPPGPVQQNYPPQPRQLPAGDEGTTINGVPLSEAERNRRTS